MGTFGGRHFENALTALAALLLNIQKGLAPSGASQNSPQPWPLTQLSLVPTSRALWAAEVPRGPAGEQWRSRP